MDEIFGACGFQNTLSFHLNRRPPCYPKTSTACFPGNKLFPPLRGTAAPIRGEALHEDLAWTLFLGGNHRLLLAPVLAVDLDIEPEAAVEDEDQKVTDGNGVIGYECFPATLEEPAVGVGASHGDVPEPPAGASEEGFGEKFSSQTLLKRCRNPQACFEIPHHDLKKGSSVSKRLAHWG